MNPSIDGWGGLHPGQVKFGASTDLAHRVAPLRVVGYRGLRDLLTVCLSVLQFDFENWMAVFLLPWY